MNALAKMDLQVAYDNMRRVASEEVRSDRDKLGLATEAVEKLCHVCAALGRENEELRRELGVLTQRLK